MLSHNFLKIRDSLTNESPTKTLLESVWTLTILPSWPYILFFVTTPSLWPTVPWSKCLFFDLAQSFTNKDAIPEDVKKINPCLVHLEILIITLLGESPEKKLFNFI